MEKEREINILKHVLVPEHKIISEEERKAIFEKYKIKPEQLPKILVTDPVVKAMGAKQGDVLKITRQSKTAGEAEYFRIVVKGE